MKKYIEQMITSIESKWKGFTSPNSPKSRIRLVGVIKDNQARIKLTSGC